MKLRSLYPILAAAFLTQHLLALSPGDIAFTGFNASVNDDLAFVALAAIPAGTEIFFTDNEWNGSALGSGGAFNTGEMEFKWVAPAGGVAAGVVVTLNGVGVSGPTASLGSVSHTISSNLGISAGADIIYAFEGTTQAPTVFLSAITNAAVASADAVLTGTGLAYGTNAVALPSNSDGGEYKDTAPRAGQATFAAYAAIIADVATNWVSNTTGGTVYLPFNIDPFSIGAIANTLTLSVSPASFLESATNPAGVGTISRSNITASDLVVTLTSPDTTELTVPGTVTILANQASQTFDVTAQDDSLPDGNHLVTITASAPASTGTTFGVTVQDDGDPLPPTALQTGDIAFTCLNGDRDAVAFVALDFIPGDAVIHFCDSEWDGSVIDGADHFASGEGDITWTAPVAGIPAGTVIVIDTYDATATANIGTASGSSGLSATDESIYAYQGLGVRQPITFLALISNHNDGTPDSIANTGLTLGSTALLLPNGTDFAEFKPSERSGQATFPAYLPLIGDIAANWTSGGEGTFNATLCDATNFTLSGSPASTVSIGSASIVEGNSLTSTLVLNVTRSDTTTGFTVNYAVTGGDATPNTDYATLANGTLSFPAAGAATLPINLTINGDTDPENDETVIVTLSGVVNTTGTTAIGTAAGTATILNDDASGPQVTTQPGSVTIISGAYTTLSLMATGSPTPSVQWYQGVSGNTTTPVGTNSTSFTTPALTAATSYWARVSNVAGNADSNTATVNIGPTPTSIDLSTYVRIGRYNLPEPTRTALPPGTASHNLLAQEASGVTYNWDTGTLFICSDGGRSITQVSKTGDLVDTMSLALGSSPQGTEFYDPEGIAYIGSGQFVITEERNRQLVRFTYVAGTTLLRSNAQTIKIGTDTGNEGTEGLSYDPQTDSPPNIGLICLKEINPQGIFQTGVDFTALTATNGSPTTVNSINLFDPTLAGLGDVADVFALSNLPHLNAQPQSGNLLLLSHESARIVNISRAGSIASTLQIVTDPGNPLSVADQQHEGLTMDRDGILYVISENGGGSINFPQLWVYAPSGVPNQAPTAVALNNTITAIAENTPTTNPVKVADIVVTDDGLGTNALSVTGADAAFFEITGATLFIKAGTVLDFETKTSYSLTVNVDDASAGNNPDATVNYTLTVTDVVNENPVIGPVIVSEVHSSGNDNGTYAADWFELTNTTGAAIDITGWQVDDSSNGTAKLPLRGLTSLPAGAKAIFIEAAVDGSLDLKRIADFATAWFGSPNLPPGFLIGTYGGSGIGLSASGDSVNIFDATVPNANRITGVSFGAATPGTTFDNTAGIGSTTTPLPAVTTLSVVGTNGAHLSRTSPAETGSPGGAQQSTAGTLLITEVAPWSSGNSPVGADWFELTNTGTAAVDITGWKVDDVSESPAASVALNGITSIAPGESVIFVETATPLTTLPAFRNTWFGANPPAALQIGSYTGSGVSLETDSDAVNLYHRFNIRQANVFFGASPAGPSFPTFDNTAGVNFGSISTLSSVGVNNAFAAITHTVEIGSPGPLFVPPPAGTFAAWLAANSYTSGGFGTDSDFDGLDDGVEYYFNQNPNSGVANGHLPHLVPTAGDFEFQFTRLAGINDATGSLQVSSDLAQWDAAILGIDYSVLGENPNGNEIDVAYRLLGSGPSDAGVSIDYTTPNLAATAGASLGGAHVVNKGLVGVGRLSGELLDQFNETMGAASGLFITDWVYNGGTSTFSGKFNVLPDRGYNSGSTFSNYAARIHEINFTFQPYYGTAPAGATPALSQGQIVPLYEDSTKLTYQDGPITKFTSGLNPTGTGTLFSQTVGTVMAANGEGGSQQSLVSFDAEALHVFPDGSGYASDEYGTYIARFNPTKLITGITQLPEAARPHIPAMTLNFDSVNAPVNGRRNNQGLEGMSVSPDGTRLFALMQSGLVQDTNSPTTANQQTRNNTRLFVYDIVGPLRDAPQLIGEYVVKLPRFRSNGNGSAVDRTAAQSEISAISNQQFLMLARDGNGLGIGTTTGTEAPTVYKSVILVDFASATNILGMFDHEGEAVSPGGVLGMNVKAAASKDVVNLLNPADHTRFGVNTTNNTPDMFTLNEKMEGMALVPDLSTPQADDYFLFVANDNDFQSSDVKMLNAAGAFITPLIDARANAGNGPVTNDAVFYAYRLIIDATGSRFFRYDVTGN